jgi:DNA primase
MSDERDAIRARIDIVDLVMRDGVRLKKTGKNFTGLCPFHADKNPSFYVSSETGRYRCFACGAKGDVFDWVMKRQNVDFVEALSLLAHEAGIELKGRSETSKSERVSQQNAMEVAQRFFRDQFAKSTAAQAYCERRGLKAEQLEAWGIGYAPDVGEALAVQLQRQGISLSEARSLFLVDQDPGGGYFDKFRGRLTFPIHDERGTLVAFGGRLLGDGHPKYINSGDTPLYRKSRILYGMHQSRGAMTESRRAVLCEGYLDVIACHRAGVPTAIASLGTSLTEDHARLLKRWCDEVTILYDADAAGQKAAARAVEVLNPEGLRIRIALMPEGEDPDTLLQRKGAEAVRQAVDSGISPVDYRIRLVERETPPDHPDHWSRLFEVLADADSELELAGHIDRIAGRFPGTRDVVRAAKAIRTEITKIRRGRKVAESPSPAPRGGRTITPTAAALLGDLLGSERILFRAFLSDEFRRSVFMLARHKVLFESGRAQLISEGIAKAFPSGAPTGLPANWLPTIEPEAARDALSDILMSTWNEPLSEAVIGDAIESLRTRMARRQQREAIRSGGDKAAIEDRIRQLKPDPRIRPREPEDFL